MPDNIVFIIVFLVIGAIRWILETVNSKKSSQAEHWEEYDYEGQADSSPQKQSLEELYEEARREILDRQNRQIPEPTPSSPPPLPQTPAQQKAVTPPPPKAEEPPYQIQEVRRPVLSEAEQQALANFEKTGQGQTQRTSTKSRIRKMLSDSNAARDAVVLSEILGKPKGV